jgi:succinate dehydrogenase / fumarate reductase membrane anchor subunit
MMAELSAAGGRPRPDSGLELYAWLFMRVSGVVLLLLALGPLVIMHIIHNVGEIDTAFVADRWANPLWRLYDWLLLMLAVIHGFNGLRVIVDDYVRRPGLRVLSQVVVFSLAIFLLLTGSLIILLFQPGAGMPVLGSG